MCGGFHKRGSFSYQCIMVSVELIGRAETQLFSLSAKGAFLFILLLVYRTFVQLVL